MLELREILFKVGNIYCKIPQHFADDSAKLKHKTKPKTNPKTQKNPKTTKAKKPTHIQNQPTKQIQNHQEAVRCFSIPNM